MQQCLNRKQETHVLLHEAEMCQQVRGNKLEEKRRYLAYLGGVAEQGAQAGPALVSGQILLQTAHWKVLHDQLNGLSPCNTISLRNNPVIGTEDIYTAYAALCCH